MTSLTLNQVLTALQYAKLASIEDLSFIKRKYQMNINAKVIFRNDTRQIPSNKNVNPEKITFFIALPGKRISIQEQIDLAINSDNNVIVLAPKESNYNGQKITLRANKNLLPVVDIFATLNYLATFCRKYFNPLTIAITGSSGKTTLKEIIAKIMRANSVKKVLATQGNFNNNLGVPLTLLRLADLAHQDTYTLEHPIYAAVIEHGANHQGELRYTSRMSLPHIAVINNVQPAHTHGFGGITGVGLAKAEIFSNLADNGVKIINLDSHTNDLMFARYNQQTLLTISAKNSFADFYIDPDSFTEGDQGISFTLTISGFEVPHFNQELDSQPFTSNNIFIDPQRIKVRSNLFGFANAYNLTAAIAVTLSSGVSLDTILQEIKNIQTPSRRGNLVQGSLINILDDTYNANLGSLKHFSSVAKALKADHKYLVIGGLKELDEQSRQELLVWLYSEFFAPDAKSKELTCYSVYQFFTELIVSAELQRQDVANEKYNFDYKGKTITAIELEANAYNYDFIAAQLCKNIITDLNIENIIRDDLSLVDKDKLLQSNKILVGLKSSNSSHIYKIWLTTFAMLQAFCKYYNLEQLWQFLFTKELSEYIHQTYNIDFSKDNSYTISTQALSEFIQTLFNNKLNANKLAKILTADRNKFKRNPY